MEFLDGQWLQLGCPRCEYELEVTFLQVRLEEIVICPCCKADVQLIDQDAGPEGASRDIKEALAELENTLKRLF